MRVEVQGLVGRGLMYVGQRETSRSVFKQETYTCAYQHNAALIPPI